MADEEVMDGYEDEAPTNDVYTFLLLLALVLMTAGGFLVYKEMSDPNGYWDKALTVKGTVK